MKIIVTVFLITLLCNYCNAQKTQHSYINAISFELGKTGLIYNLTFDHKFTARNLGFRLNAGTNFAKYLNANSFGGGGYYLLGNANKFLELGVDLQYLIINKISDDQKGFAFVYPDYSTKAFYSSVNLGYRAYSKRSLFRIGFSPGLIESSFVPGAYISYGLVF